MWQAYFERRRAGLPGHARSSPFRVHADGTAGFSGRNARGSRSPQGRADGRGSAIRGNDAARAPEPGRTRR